MIEHRAYTLPAGTYIGRVASWSECVYDGVTALTYRVVCDIGLVIAQEQYLLGSDPYGRPSLGDTVAVEVNHAQADDHMSYVDVDVLHSPHFWRPGQAEPTNV